MPTAKNLKSALMRATAAAAVAAPIVMFPTAAHAVNGSVNITSIQGLPQVCRVNYGSTVTGDTNDVFPGNDTFAFTLENGTGAVLVRDNSFVQFGLTQGRAGSFDITGGRAQRLVNLRETTSSSGTLGATRFSLDLNRADLIAAGGYCLQTVQNTAPLASAGPPQNVTSGATVTLDASGTTDFDGDTITYQWTQVAGPTTIALTNPNSTMPTFIAPTVTQPTVYQFRVGTNDGISPTRAAIVAITVAPANAAPVVDAGPDQTVSGAASVQLAATASDQDNDPLTYQWTQIGGTGVTLSDATILNPTFTAPPRGANDQFLTFRLAADDGSAVTNDLVEIQVLGNQAPTAVVSAPSNIIGGQTVTLDGSGSTDPEGDSLIYQWTQIGGQTVTINNPNSAVATFDVPLASSVAQTYEFRLTVVDTFDASDQTEVTLSQAANGSPTADAGADQDATGGAVVTLDGSGSTDPENDQLFYSWVQVSGTPVTLSDPTIVNPTFTAPAATGAAQPIEFELTVTDRIKSSTIVPAQIDTVTINVLANRPPVADAGADQGPIDSGQTVTLDGTSSTDPEGDTLFYAWTQVSGTPVTLSDPNAAQPTFTAPVVAGSEDLEFSLTVTDSTGAQRTIPQQTDTVVVAIQAVGSITIIQQITGRDTDVAFTSDLSALTANVRTSGGTAQVSASNVAAGSYTVTAPDLSAQGYVVTDITCNDTDSVVDLTARSVSLELSANEDLVCTFNAANAREAASAAINNFLTGRNALILSHQPDLQRRLDRLSNPMGEKSGAVTAYGVPVPGSDNLPVRANVSRGSAQVNTSLSMALGGGSGDGRALDIWGEAYFSNATIGQQEGNFSILYLGADLKVSEGLLIGALVQKDEFGNDGDLEAGEAEGDGWMAGPYFTAQLGPQLFAEARAAWGKSDNTVSPLAGQLDDFDTSRSFYSGSLIGQFDLGATTTLRPELTVRYLSENQKAYADSNGISIPTQTVAQGDVSFRPRLSHLVKMDSGWALRPFGEVEGIYTFGTGPDAALRGILPEGFAPTLGDFRGRIEGGVDLISSGSFRATLSGFYDGIGADNFESTGVHVGVSFGF